MKRLLCALLLVTALPCAAGPEAANSSVPGREAARCAAFYKMLGSATGGSSRNFALAAGVLHKAALAEASAVQVTEWMSAFLKELPSGSEGEFARFLDVTNKQCSGLASRAVEAYLAKVGPEASARNRIVKRHASRRPSEAEVFGETVTFSDADGPSCEAPIVLAGTTDREARIRAQGMWIADQKKSWKVGAHATRYSQLPKTTEELEATRIYSEHTLADAKGNTRNVCFDTTASAKAELRDLVDAQSR